MAEIGVTNPTLVDVLSRTDPDGNIARIIEAAEEMNPIVGDAVWEECNDGSRHVTTIRTGIPEPAFRKYNQGVQPSKSETAQVVDTTGMVEDYIEVDKALADKSRNAEAFRASEVVAHLQGFNEFIATNIFYGDTDTTPEGFLGLDARFNDPNVASGRQLVNAAGSGSDNTSIWFVTWGGNGCRLLYPEGSSAGFQHNNLGEQTASDPVGGTKQLMQVYRDHMRWDVGLTVGDWRSVARVCNIDVSDLTKNAATGADLLDLMIDAEEMLDTASTVSVSTAGELVKGKTCIYVGRTVAKFLRKQALNKANVNLTVEEVAGKRVTMWGEYPIYRVDAISETESAISFA